MEVLYGCQSGDLPFGRENLNSNGNMAFDYDIPFDCYIKANYTLVSAALLNLVKNAAAYSKGTEITLKITGEDEKFYWFSFSDNGMVLTSLSSSARRSVWACVFFRKLMRSSSGMPGSFARLAASSKQLPEKVGTMEFPHDELGDISRQIVSIYRAKDKALARSVHEHKIAQRANEWHRRVHADITVVATFGGIEVGLAAFVGR